ncbi:plasmid pRiA4b ORF-3 family protein [Microvirga sp. VF16]|uniref:plasmid pRiA4b ORF-3 family protein n=1 Tax=Microvirga sp. VF16 TaxID=2807101 RepID=UPI0021119587|nr:plasmid pRiA4b ORF-3 family protein [Microvirga sp. VF16]
MTGRLYKVSSQTKQSCWTPSFVKAHLIRTREAGPSQAPEILRFKTWLLGISPMVWRRVQMPASVMLRGLHDVIQVAMC